MMDEWNKSRSLQPDHAAFERDAKQTDNSRERDDRRKAALDESLDRGLQDRFPGSDPVAVAAIQRPRSAPDLGNENTGFAKSAAQQRACP